MLKNLKQLYGCQLEALDGPVGHVKDFYFDDRTWTVRYLIADTGTWLTNRQVLLSPHSVGKLTIQDKKLRLKLTRNQIENCPRIDQHKPVSRQYEEQYYQYYGWPGYWQGGGLWGMTGVPIVTSPKKSTKCNIETSSDQDDDLHLRSAQAVKGYNVQTKGKAIGQVIDFLIDDKSWAIRQLRVKSGHLFSHKEILIPIGRVKGISFEESTVSVGLAKIISTKKVNSEKVSRLRTNPTIKKRASKSLVRTRKY